MNEVIYDPVDGLLRLGLAFLLFCAILLFARSQRLGLSKELLVATVRAFVQLMIVVTIIAAVFQSQSLFLVLVILTGMQVVAAFTSARRAQAIASPLGITLPSIVGGVLLMLGAMVLIRVIPLKPEFLIPIGSMVTGACMVACSLALDRLLREIESNRHRIETALTLGASWDEALSPYTRLGVRTSLIPSVDRFKTLGIVVLPGAMAGMIIGGVNPFYAAEYQLIIFFMIIGGELITAFMATHLARGRLSLY